MNRAPWNQRSLGTTLAIWYGASAFLLMAVTAAFLYLSLTRAVNSQHHLILLEKAQTLERFFQESPQNEEGLKARVKEWAERQFERIYVQIREINPAHSSSGQVFFQTGPDGLFLPSESARGSVDLRFDGRTYVIEPFAQGPYLVHIALDETASGQILKNYRTRMIFVAAFAFVMSILIGLLLARKGVQPILDISRTTGRINSSNLSERINLQTLPAEFSDLATTFNDMLNRLEEYVNRLSRFSADMAHELRTPVNNMIGEFGVALTKSRSLKEYQDALASGIEECERLAKIIEALLFGAR